MDDKTKTFEENLKGLEACADTLRKEGGTLEEAMKAYEEGIRYYEECSAILENAKQKIELYRRKAE